MCGVDLEASSPADILHLGSIFNLDDAALEDCIHGPARPRVDEYESYLALCFFSVLVADDAQRFSPRRLAIFCSERFLITVHPEPLPSVGSLSARCQKHGAGMFERGIDVVLYRLVDALVDNYLEQLDRYDDDLSELETASYDPGTGEPILRGAVRLRNELMEVRRLASAQYALLAPVARGEFDYVSEHLSGEFRHVQEHLAHAVDTVDGMRDRLAGAVSNYHATLAKRTNDIVRVLTVFAAVLLPLSLVAGIYGMNVPVWPPGDQSESFWTILAAMGALAGCLLWFFRTRHWF